MGNPPVISSSSTSGGIPSIKRIRAGSYSRFNKLDGISRIRIVCKEGDLLFVNTRLWWHQTFLPRSDDSRHGLSISYARDFVAPMLSLERSCYYQTPKKSDDDEDEDDNDDNNVDDDEECQVKPMTNVEGVYASRNVRKGSIVLRQSELPDCSLPESQYYNCEVCEMDDGSLALIAAKDIVAGDWLTVSFSSDDSSDDDDSYYDPFHEDDYADLYGDGDVKDNNSFHDDNESNDDEIDTLSVD